LLANSLNLAASLVLILTFLSRSIANCTLHCISHSCGNTPAHCERPRERRLGDIPHSAARVAIRNPPPRSAADHLWDARELVGGKPAICNWSGDTASEQSRDMSGDCGHQVVDGQSVGFVRPLECREKRSTEALNDRVLQTFAGVVREVSNARRSFGLVDRVERGARKIEKQIVERADTVDDRTCLQVID
jgi:hypothetical protein